jgi:hypothetical protein
VVFVKASFFHKFVKSGNDVCFLDSNFLALSLSYSMALFYVSEFTDADIYLQTESHMKSKHDIDNGRFAGRHLNLGLSR